MEQLGTSLLTLIGIVVVAALLLGGFVRSDQVLDKWAANNGYRILKREHILTGKRNDFLVKDARSMYHVIVIDAAGNEKRGLVMCGNLLLGVLINTAEVKWDD